MNRVRSETGRASGGARRRAPRVIEYGLVQAGLFGLLHVNGFPRGAVGVILAGGYGVALGFIRKFSGGLAAPGITHFFADATIFGILVFIKI